MRGYESGSTGDGWGCRTCQSLFVHAGKYGRTYAVYVAHLLMNHGRLPYRDGDPRNYTATVTVETSRVQFEVRP